MRLRKFLFAAVAASGFLFDGSPSHAHEGPPYSVVEKAAIGNYELSVWADADVGDGSLWVVVSPPGAGAATATTLSASLRPDGSSSPALIVAGRLEAVGGVAGDRFVIDAPFASPGLWDVQLTLAGARGQGAYAFTVDVLPEGPQPEQMPFYLLPFVVLAVLAGFALWRSRNRGSPR